MKNLFVFALCCCSFLLSGAPALLPEAPKDAPFGIWSDWIKARQVPVRIIKEKGLNRSDIIIPDLKKHARIAVEKIKLEKGKRYRFGAYVKTENLKCRTSAFIIHNHYWRRDIRSRALPANTANRWVKVEGFGIAPESANKLYTFNLYINKLESGKVEICAPFIEEAPLETAAPAPKKAVTGNLLPDFTASYDGPLGLWSRNRSKWQRLPKEGVNDQDALRVTGGLRLSELKLAAGGTYRFGAWFRTSKLNNKDSAVIIYDYKWHNDVRTGKIPADTQGKWQKVEATLKLPPSKNKMYTFLIYLPEGGTYDICAPFIEPVCEKAKSGSEKAASYLPNIKRIFPVTPVLSRIEAEKPEITFSYVTPLPGKTSDYIFRMRLAGKEGNFSKWQEYPIPANRQIKTLWPKQAPGPGAIQVEICKKGSSKAILANEYTCSFLEPLPPFKSKRLNNLVTELFSAPAANGKVDFVNPREGWGHISLAGNHPKAQGILDKKLILCKRPGEKLETMRYLKRGKHTLHLSGVTKKSLLTIRSVPEIMLFPLSVNEKSDFNTFQYSREFYIKHLWPAINTYFLLFGWNPKTAWKKQIGAELAQRGFKVMGFNGFRADEWLDKEKMLKDFFSNFAGTSTVGRAIDETAASAEAPLLHTYSESCWELTEWDKFIYLWLASTTDYLNYPLLHAPLISGASNIGFGRGKLLMETYVETTPDLKSLKEYYTLVSKHLQYAKQSTPDAPERMMLIMSGLLTAGAWDCNGYPQSDIKYALDYFFHLVATVPDGKGLYGVGCYNFNYADEENARWIGKLLRHYAVEGNKEMLSPRYGIVYNGNHVKNPDFKEKTAHWQIFPAEKESIRPRTIAGYGFRKQRRRGPGHGNGDTVLEFRRSAKGANKITQTFKNFVPGKLYSLSFVTSDADDLEKNRNRRSYSFLDARLEGAEIIPELSSEFRNPPTEKVHRFEVVTRKIVFRAKQKEIKATFSDWKDAKTPGGPAGARRLLNFISVKSYFAEK